MENLRPHAVVAIDSVTCFQTRFSLAEPALLHHAISTQLIDQIQTVLALTEVEDYSTRLPGDLFERRMKLKASVVDQRTKHVARDVLGVNANENRILSLHVAHHHREMYVAIDHVLIGNRAETTVDRRQIAFHYALHQLLFADAISDELCDADHLQVMLSGESFELRETRHGPVFVHDLADHAGRIQTRDPGNVDAGFGLSGTNEHAAALGAQGENMTWTTKILRTRVWIDRH